MSEENIYKTTNFHVAIWLLMNNVSLKEIDWSNKKRAQFIFEDFPDRDTLVSDFFRQEQLQKYISRSQELKARMYTSNSPVEYDQK